ncbi:hypothetical protein GCM10009530_56930 [Microbispora corallina]|uniref:Uncharacterized protein n=1 Tax=Microbispora corallina TaxID=83302 RepID=A0ABQ4G8S5_9ACTN|nr:hypothetical protein [Microbispora corallina]GIH43486.1 hypothetical protein Mco01_64860 [Microbispora corallina]
MPVSVIHGEDLLEQTLRVHFPGHDLHSAPAQPLLEKVGVWLPREAYYEWPIMLPWALRDLGCRGNKRDKPDIWSSPGRTGHFLDDNTMIKGLIRPLTVRSPGGPAHGKRLRGGFVAAHIWRIVHHADLASRIPGLYSFIPNIVWLPKEVAKRTDYEGGIYQRTLQAMSAAIYRNAPVKPALDEVVNASWEMLPGSALSVAQLRPAELNWFEVGPSFHALRRTRLNEVLAALRSIEKGKPLMKKVIATRYTIGLPLVPPAVRATLLADLTRFESGT